MSFMEHRHTQTNRYVQWHVNSLANNGSLHPRRYFSYASPPTTDRHSAGASHRRFSAHGLEYDPIGIPKVEDPSLAEILRGRVQHDPMRFQIPVELIDVVRQETHMWRSDIAARVVHLR